MNYHNNRQYIESKERLNTIYSKKVNGTRIRSKCDWYDNGEKSQGFIRSSSKNKIEVKNQSEIKTELYKSY